MSRIVYEYDVFVDFRLQFQFELRNWQFATRPFDEKYEMTHAFDDLTNLVESQRRMSIERRFWQMDRDFNAVFVFTNQQHFAFDSPFARPNEIVDCRRIINAVCTTKSGLYSRR